MKLDNIICIIHAMLEKLTSFVNWCNHNLLLPLDSDLKISVFVGVCSLFIAIVVFIAQVINKKQLLSEKFFIKKKTNMLPIFILVVVTLALCPISTAFSETLLRLDTPWIYFLCQLIIDSFIVLSISLIIKLFYVSVNLVSNNKYFRDEYYKFIDAELFLSNGATNKVDLIDDLLFIYFNRNQKYARTFILNVIQKMFDEDKLTMVDFAFESIRICLINFKKDNDRLLDYARFVRSVSNICISYNKIDYFIKANEYLYYCYIGLLKNGYDSREASYQYAFHFKESYYFADKKYDDSLIPFHDCLMSYYLRYLIKLLQRKEKVAFEDMLANVNHELLLSRYVKNDSIRLINLNFTYGFSSCISLLYDEKLISKNDSSFIRKSLNIIKQRYLTHSIDLWAIINNLLRIEEKHSEINKFIKEFSFDLEDNKFRNTFTGWAKSTTSLIKLFLTLYGLDWSVKTKLELKDIDPTMLWFYQGLLSDIKDNNQFLIENELGILYDNSVVVELLEQAINLSKDIQSKLDLQRDIDKKIVNNFAQIIVSSIQEGTELTKYLQKQGKLLYLKEQKLKRLELRYILDRSFFFPDVTYIDSFAQSCADRLLRGRDEQYIKFLDKSSTLINTDFWEFIKTINNYDDYIVLASHHARYIIERKAKEVSQKINFEYILNTSNTDVYLVKKNKLPSLKLFKYDEKKLKFDNWANTDYVYICFEEMKNNEGLYNHVYCQPESSKEKQPLFENVQNECLFQASISSGVENVEDFECYKFSENQFD